LLTAKGWTLSPAYDMNPTLNDHQSLLINSKTNKADLSILLDSCEEYMLTLEVAKGIINEVVTAVKVWRVLANRLGIAKREMTLFEGVFDNRIKNLNNL
ncbi:MAG: type II toxin-antitoxin system HipA family toxin, partial [Paludibacteraceae bacterium]|nr:type II toxin-antitoxin system HipA family toxin [Paludibacteraceae bacterium]